MEEDRVSQGVAILDSLVTGKRKSSGRFLEIFCCLIKRIIVGDEFTVISPSPLFFSGSKYDAWGHSSH